MTAVELNTALTALADDVRRSTVHIQGRGGGSGVIWQENGLIITNAHVARGPVDVMIADGRRFSASLLARDRDHDLAALQISALDLPAAPIGDSDRLEVGQLVLAVGNPLGMVGAVSFGIIHAVGDNWVRSDIRLLPGNSGGPLIDAWGRVVGINSMVAGGLGLSVPSNDVQTFLEALQVMPEVA